MELAQILNIPGGKVQGPLPTIDATGNTRFTDLASFVTNLLPYIFPISGVFLLFYLIWGGFSYLTSMGDPKKAAAGQAKITNAILGFLLIFVAFLIVQIVDYLFGLNLY
ncbi:hypothetical protein HYW55_05790 [Candidatus Gottesmanbacteria bacterium]|nr:hypothetical protein [Candidatus Gottesmanbacteria bacterium]